MPSSWLGPADGDYQSFTPARGDLLEVKVVDGEGAEQGTLLVAVVSRQACHGPGEAFEGHCLGASDECYRYWITEGEGRHLRESGLYHLCFKSIAECRIWRGKKEVVHTDHFRFVTPSDLKEGKIRWARTRDVKAEILGQLAKFEAKYPVARPRRKGAGVPKAEGGEGGGKASLSASEENPSSSSSDSSEEEELVKKMAKLQAELKAAEKLVSDKRGVKAKKKAMKAMKAKEKDAGDTGRRARSKSPVAKDKEKTRHKKKKDKEDGEKEARDKKRRRESPSDAGGEKRRKKKKEKKSRSTKGKKEKDSPSGEEESMDAGLFRSHTGKKDTKNKGMKDRGPFGSGPPVQFKDGESSESESGEDSVFREAPAGSTSLRLLLKMKEGAARELVGANNEEGATPPLASHFVLTVLMPQLGPKASLRTQRELRTLAKGLDLLARGETSQCADLLGQRIKALETAAQGHWMSAFRHLHIAGERRGGVYLAREFLLEQKVRKYDKHKFPPIPPGGKRKDQARDRLERTVKEVMADKAVWRRLCTQLLSNGVRAAQLWGECWPVSWSRKGTSGVVHPVRCRRKICFLYR